MSEPHVHQSVPADRQREPASAERPGQGLERTLRRGLWITGGMLATTLFGAVASRSLALLSDAFHVVSDFGALAGALVAERLNRRPADARRTLGYGRARVISALSSSVSLLGMAVGIGYEGVMRLTHPEAINAVPMALAALADIAGNAWIALGFGSGASRLLDRARRLPLLRRLTRPASPAQTDHSQNLNARGALSHVLGDVATSLAVVGGAAATALLGVPYIDPALSIGIAGLLAARSAIPLLGESLRTLLGRPPKGIDPLEVARTIRRVRGVKDVWDLSVTSMGGGEAVISGKFRYGPHADPVRLAGDAERSLAEVYSVGRCTLQPCHQRPPDARLLARRSPLHLLRGGLSRLMAGPPKGVDPLVVAERIRRTPGVKGVWDLGVTSTDGRKAEISGRFGYDPHINPVDLAGRIERSLGEFPIARCTMQPSQEEPGSLFRAVAPKAPAGLHLHVPGEDHAHHDHGHGHGHDQHGHRHEHHQPEDHGHGHAHEETMGGGQPADVDLSGLRRSEAVYTGANISLPLEGLGTIAGGGGTPGQAAMASQPGERAGADRVRAPVEDAEQHGFGH